MSSGCAVASADKISGGQLGGMTTSSQGRSMATPVARRGRMGYSKGGRRRREMEKPF